MRTRYQNPADSMTQERMHSWSIQARGKLLLIHHPLYIVRPYFQEAEGFRVSNMKDALMLQCSFVNLFQPQMN